MRPTRLLLATALCPFLGAALVAGLWLCVGLGRTIEAHFAAQRIGNLPLLTRFFLSFSSYLAHYGYLLSVLIVGVSLAVAAAFGLSALARRGGRPAPPGAE